jgi:SRSO17 transposase
MDWDHDDLNRQRVERMLTLRTEGDGVLIFDDTGFAKQGRSSVGVARQYSGTLGKVGNCQVTVNCHYAERILPPFGFFLRIAADSEKEAAG